jgi:hypothetical protein
MLGENSVDEIFISQAPTFSANADKEVRLYDENLCNLMGQVLKKEGALVVDSSRTVDINNIEPFLNKTSVFKKLCIVQTSVSDTASVYTGMWKKQ